jgi:hypothetical protein
MTLKFYVYGPISKILAAPAIIQKTSQYQESYWAFHPRPTTSYMVESILAKRINSRSSISQKLLEPTFCLTLAIALFEILALYRNLVKYLEIECGWFSIQDQHLARWLVSLWKEEATKGILPATIQNPV